MTFTLRKAQSSDVALILQFIKELAEYEKLAHAVEATEARLRQTLFGPQPYAEVLIAEDADGALGFALYFGNYSTFLAKPGIYLEDLFVRPAARGRGVGLELIAQLAALVVARDWGRLEWAVLNWNEPALGFYRSLGARAQDEWGVQRMTGEALQALAARARLSV